MAAVESADERSQPIRLNLGISGVYAWLTTVGVPAASSFEPFTLGLAALALALLSAGLWLLPRSPSWGRGLAMPGFVSACAACWILLGDALTPARLHPLQAASGALGWVLFAFSWGAVRNVRAVPENDPRVVAGKPLKPRARLHRSAYVAFTVALVGGLVPWLLAWRVTRPSDALLAHAVGLAAALAMVAVGARSALQTTQPVTERTPRQRLGAASNALAGLLLVVVLGLLAWQLD
jgi:hypothetical protein